MKEFSVELDSKFKGIINEFPDLSRKQMNYWRKTITEQLTTLFDLLIRKKALYTIEFDGYLLYRSMLALITISDEVKFKVKESQLFFLPSRR